MLPSTHRTSKSCFRAIFKLLTIFLKKIFWLQNCLWQAVFHYKACESLENELLWCSLQNRNVNTRSSGESVSFGGWKTWPSATFYLSFLRKNKFSSKFSKKKFLVWPILKENSLKTCQKQLQNFEKNEFFSISQNDL